MSGVEVLVIVGSRESAFTSTLAELDGESSPDATRVSVFDSVDKLPPFSETAATAELPRSVNALRNAAAAADAVLLVTHYYAPVPAIVHNAIDWLTMHWNDSELHEKPLAVIGYSADRYCGVWSHRQSGQRREISESRIIEPITVGSLREAVAKLAGEVSTVRRSGPWHDTSVTEECSAHFAPGFARDTNCPL
jgi:hypothetical protein